MEKHVLRKQLSSRGGGIEISLNHMKGIYVGQKMTAYQNYLGGGMLGSIANDCTIRDWKNDPKLVRKAEKLRKYFAELMGIDYEFHQRMPHSAY